MGGTEKRRKHPVEPASITKRTTLSAESNRKTESDGEQEMGECFLCGARDAALCKACGVVYVCPLHISYHQVDLIPPQSVLSFYFKQLEVFFPIPACSHCFIQWNWNWSSFLQNSDGCAPYKVATLEGAGRGLVAVRDIKWDAQICWLSQSILVAFVDNLYFRKGELIFTSLPAALGPTARWKKELGKNIKFNFSIFIHHSHVAMNKTWKF